MRQRQCETGGMWREMGERVAGAQRAGPLRVPRARILLLYLLFVESTEIPALLSDVAPRLGRRTALTFPLFPPPQKN